MPNVFADFIKKFFSESQEPDETVDIPELIRQIKEREDKDEVPLGRRIHTFAYKEFQLSLDRDITENYRVTAYIGQDRIYSFSIFANQGNYNILEKGYSEIIQYLDGDRNIQSLPDNEIIKGFFYGH